MKRTLLDMTKKISRNPIKVELKPKDLENPTYWIFEAKGYRFTEILREIEVRKLQDRISVYVNTQNISPRDYVVQSGNDGLIIKFIKNKFEYELDEFDYIEVTGDIEKYA
jgi:predicted DNA-binding transcriptional regulator